LIFDSKKVIAEPDMTLSRRVGDLEAQQYYGVTPESLKRPLVLIAQTPEGAKPVVFKFHDEETYEQRIKRLQVQLAWQGVSSAIAASPPLVLPGENGEINYLSLEEAIGNFAAKDMRHYIYLPYFNERSLLYPELARMQGLDPTGIVPSIDGGIAKRILLPLRESLEGSSVEILQEVLDATPYQGRYKINGNKIEINLLEGVYSHLVLGVTQHGKIVVIQTSGTHGNITGNDGPSYRHLVAMIKDANQQPPFLEDPINCAFSGSQGNDVSKVICASAIKGGAPVIADYYGQGFSKRDSVTTPRVAIVTDSYLPYLNLATTIPYNTPLEDQI
jgi:hypothetical protein